jgi:hypothetical protein
MSDRDDAAAAYYEDPDHRRLTGSPRKRSGQASRLTTHVPVRFSATVIERVKELAAADGKSVSSWIRDVVDREILRREQPQTMGTMPTMHWERRSIPQLTSSTVGSSVEDISEELQELVCGR